MNTVQKINKQAQKLPEQSQKEALDFIDFLLSKTLHESTRQNDLDWYNFSLATAMQGIEGEETVTYDESDLKEKWG